MSGAFAGVSAVILAAGMSRRFGPRNKLLQTIEGEVMARRAVQPFVGLGLKEVVVAMGHEADRVRAALAGLPLRFVVNERYAEGMGSSLACAARSLDRDGLDGILVSLADLPYLQVGDVAAVCRAFCEGGAKRIVVPSYREQQGHPVCFPARLIEGLASLRGDEGARRLVQGDAETCILEMESAGCVRDRDR